LASYPHSYFELIFDKLYHEKVIAGSIRIEDKLGNDPFYISRCYEEIKKTSPHKHENYYELVYLSEGEGFHWIESEKYVISVPEVYFLKPGQLHHWQFTSVPKGYVILFKKSYFDDICDGHIINLIAKLSGRFRTGIPSDYSPESVFKDIMYEYSNNGEYSSKIIHGYLMALLAKILQIASNIRSDDNHIHKTLYEKYQELIIMECPPLNKVMDFAKILNTTPQNLNAACRRQIGKNAKEPILHQLLLESKRYLLHTENTLNEISTILQFNDTSYFVKFFKRKEGLSPLQFRKKYFQ
jgi:AraC family transcriptional activator of pobA